MRILALPLVALGGLCILRFAPAAATFTLTVTAAVNLDAALG